MGHKSKSSSSSHHGCSSSTSCRVPSCNVSCCANLCSSELSCRLSSAVVRVHGQAILTSIPPQAGVPNFVWNPTSTQPAFNTAVYETYGNGFFIKGHKIVTSANIVTIPPDVLAQNGGVGLFLNRYPFVDSTGAFRDGNGVPNSITQVSRILVDVFNVNGRGESFTYQARLESVDPAGNIAVLCIDGDNDWNSWNPCIDCCHPYFRFSKSRKSKAGDPAFFIGDWVNGSNGGRPASNGVIQQGQIVDNKFIDYDGGVQAELILTDLRIMDCATGLPILNNCGAVIGMQVSYNFPTDDGASVFAVGISEFFMRRVLKAFLQGCDKRKYGKHLGTVTDALGNYYYYIKGYLGLAWTVVTGRDLGVLYTQNGVPVATLDAAGAYGLVQCKDIVGLRVKTVAATSAPQTVDVDNPTTLATQASQISTYASAPYFDSTTLAQYPSNLQGYAPDTGTGDVNASPFAGLIDPNDIVFEIARCQSSCGTRLKKKCKLGDLHHQIAPGLYTWGTMPGDPVFVEVRSYNAIATAKTPLDYWNNFVTLQGTMATFPLLEDWPWYTRDCWPTVNAPYTSVTGNRPFLGFQPTF
jgi:hypothetical protein